MSKEDVLKSLEQDIDYQRLKKDDFIKQVDCKKGRIYRIHSRNLTFGVFDGEKGFIGIREKFGDRYLFREYHSDSGPPFGTVKPLEDTRIDLPEGMPLSEFGDGGRSKDSVTGRYVEFKVLDEEHGTGGWYFVDTGEFSKRINPMLTSNKDLFKFLQRIEKKWKEEGRMRVNQNEQ